MIHLQCFCRLNILKKHVNCTHMSRGSMPSDSRDLHRSFLGNFISISGFSWWFIGSISHISNNQQQIVRLILGILSRVLCSICWEKDRLRISKISNSGSVLLKSFFLNLSLSSHILWKQQRETRLHLQHFACKCPQLNIQIHCYQALLFAQQ